jgi:hypothetical protein
MKKPEFKKSHATVPLMPCTAEIIKVLLLLIFQKAEK